MSIGALKSDIILYTLKFIALLRFNCISNSLRAHNHRICQLENMANMENYAWEIK